MIIGRPFKTGHTPWGKGISGTERREHILYLNFRRFLSLSDKIPCVICGDLFYKITSQHLKKHNITMEEYRRRYPKSPLMSDLLHRNLSKYVSGLGGNHPMRQPEIKAKVGESLRGKPPAIKGKTFEEFYGSKRAKAIKRNLRDAHLGQLSLKKGKSYVEQYGEEKAKIVIKKMKGPRPCIKGKNHPNWRGGVSFEPYDPEFNERLKEQIRARDGCTCQLCGIKQERLGQKLDVHHIDYNKKNSKPKNLISLCRRGNLKVNYNRDYWQKYFEELM